MESSEVSRFLGELQHSRADQIRELTGFLETAHPQLNVGLKWNAPSFSVSGLNIVTMRLFPEPILQIVLHVGSKKLVDAPDLRFEVRGFEHRWADNTRCVITLPTDFENAALLKPTSTWLETLRKSQFIK